MAPDVGEVRRRLADQRMTPERQVTYWLDLWRQWPETEWGMQCLDEAERLMSLLRREATLRNSLGPHGDGGRTVGAVAPLHFVWLGQDCGIKSDKLRDGIVALANGGMISADAAQQDALRRGLGLSLNDDERHSAAPWVRWLGPTDMLWLLVEGLWQLSLITCAGGRQQKWRTACGIFLHADGTPYGPNLKNSRCTQPTKKADMRMMILGSLATYSGHTCPCVDINVSRTRPQ